MRIFREPLLHFFILGAIVFVAFSLLDEGSEPAAAERIEITDDIEDSLATQFERTWRRPPTEAELSALVNNFIEEEVLVREALLLGLDRGDAVIRQRLSLKMKFLLEAGGAALEPDDEDLTDFLTENAERYEIPARLSFEQVLFEQSAGETEAVLAALNSGQNRADVGAATLLPATVSDATPHAVDSVFGAGFFAQLQTIPGNLWAGPVESGYGMHLVRITGSTPAQMPSLDDVRESVTRDWIAVRTEEAGRQRLDALTSRYDVVRATSGETE